MADFKESVQPIIERYIRNRKTRFCSSHHITAEQLHVHNKIPVWYLVKKYKSEQKIKSRLYKSLTEEQRQSWLNYYDQNKQLELLTNQEHENFHSIYDFDIKTESWKEKHEIITEVPPPPAKTTKTQKTSATTKKSTNESVPVKMAPSPKSSSRKRKTSSNEQVITNESTEEKIDTPTLPQQEEPAIKPKRKVKVKVKKASTAPVAVSVPIEESPHHNKSKAKNKSKESEDSSNNDY